MAELVYINKDLLNDSIQEIKTQLGITDPCTFLDILSQVKFSSGTMQITATASSTTNATTDRVEIAHGLEKIPNYIIFWKNNSPRGSISYTGTSNGYSTTMYRSYYETFACIVDVKQNTTTSIYINNTSSSYTASSGRKYYIPTSNTRYASENLDTTTSSYVIQQVNENSFTSPLHLQSGSTYKFIAF